MAGNETAVHATVSSTSSGARARSGTRRRRRRRWIRYDEEDYRRGVRRRAAVPAGGLSKRNMAAGCCGAKKQRLGGGGGAAPSLSPCDGTAIRHGIPQSRKPATIAQPEMGFFCFDVLYCQLHQLDPPKTPNFSNEALWVVLRYPLFFSLSLLPPLSLSFSLSLFFSSTFVCPSVRLTRASRQLLSFHLSRMTGRFCHAMLDRNRGDIFITLNADITEVYRKNIIFYQLLCLILIFTFSLRVMNFEFRIDDLNFFDLNFRRSRNLSVKSARLHCWCIVWSSRVRIICRRAMHALSRRASIYPIVQCYANYVGHLRTLRLLLRHIWRNIIDENRFCLSKYSHIIYIILSSEKFIAKDNKNCFYIVAFVLYLFLLYVVKESHIYLFCIILVQDWNLTK